MKGLKTTTILCVCAVLSGCNKPYEWEQYQEFQPKLDAMKFTASVKTMQESADGGTAEVKFPEGSTFGMYAVVRGPREELKPSGNYLDNLKFTSDASGSVSPGKDLVWPDEILHFFAYHPYVEEWNQDDLTALEYSIPQDQNSIGEDGLPSYQSADMLYAARKGVRPNTQVDLQFSHLMANLVINVRSGIRNPDVTSLPIGLSGLALKASINMETGEVTPDEASCGNMVPYEAGKEGARQCKAVVLPQTAELVIETEFKGEAVRIVKSAFEIKGGWQYVFDLVVDDTGIKFVIADMKPWEGLESEQIPGFADKVKIPYLIGIPDFSESFVYKVTAGGGKQIAEICSEYLYKEDAFVDEEGTVPLDHKAVVAYPMIEDGTGRLVADHSRGFVLRLMKENVSGKTVTHTVEDSPVHGGAVSFDASSLVSYTPGVSEAFESFCYVDKTFSTDSYDEYQTTALEPDVVTDAPSRYEEGVSNIYKITKIGSQYWTVDNLRAVRYNDGEAIKYFAPDATSGWAGTNAARSGKYTWYKDASVDVSASPAYKNVYGALYNWTAICKGGGKDVSFPYDVETDFLAPEGWKVPFRDEYKILYSYLGENKPRMLRVLIKADMAAEGGQPDRASAQWAYDATRTFTNATNFSAINSGYCNGTKAYFSDVFYMYFATSNAATRGYGFKLPFDAGADDKYLENHWWGLSVRCIRTY